MAKRTMEIAVSLDLGPAEAQMRSFVGRYNTANVAVPSPAAGVPVGVGGGVTGGSLNSGSAEQLANASAMATAEARATGYTPLASGTASPNWGTLMQGAVQNAMYPEGAASPNWSYLMSQQGGGTVPAPNPARNNAGGRGFFGTPTSGAVRAITFLAAHQLATTYQALERADLARSLAGNDAEAFSASVEGVTGGLGGVIGGVVGASWDIGGSVLGLRDYTPGGQRDIAETENRRRGILDTAQSDLYTRQSGESIRNASFTGNRAAERARINAEADARGRKFDQTEKDAYGRLGAGQKFKYFGLVESDEYYDYDVKDGGMRAALATEAKSAHENKGASEKQRAYELNKSNREEQRDYADFTSDSNNNITHNYLVAQGWSSRNVTRNDMNVRTLTEARDAYRKFEGSAASNAYDQALREGRSRSAAQESQWRREDAVDVTALEVDADVSSLNAVNRPNEARRYEIQASTDAAVLAEQKGRNRSEVITRIKNAGLARMAAGDAQERRSSQSQSIGLNAQTSALTALANNNQLDARLAGIHGDRDLALQNVKDDDIGAGGRRDQITSNAAIQERLAVRDELRSRLDINRQLSGSQQRASLALHPGAASDAGQVISAIMEGTDLDVGHLEDRGYGPEAAERRRLGLNQLRGAEANFFRSFTFDESSPGRVFGTLDTSKITRQFKDAEDAIPKSGRHDGGASGGGFSAAGEQEIIGLLRQIANGYYPARVGP